MTDLLQAMALIAEPVIKAYHDDFRVHDAKVIATLKPGDVCLWAPVEMGSHLVVLARAGKPNARAKEHYDAVESGYHPAWYRVAIEADGGWSVVLRTDAADLVARIAAQVQAVPQAERLCELHM